jgi:hypothetical protein
LRHLDHRGHHPLALGLVQRLGFAGRTACNQEVDPFGDLPVHQRSQGREVYLP